jgi:hypothetical protein
MQDVVDKSGRHVYGCNAATSARTTQSNVDVCLHSRSRCLRHSLHFAASRRTVLEAACCHRRRRSRHATARGRRLRQASAQSRGRCGTRRYQAQRTPGGPRASESAARRQGCRRRGLSGSVEHALLGSCTEGRQSRGACLCCLQGSAAHLQLGRIRHECAHADVAIGGLQARRGRGATWLRRSEAGVSLRGERISASAACHECRRCGL